ncbi:MAG: NAD(+) diphosphatase [Halieaceae bacterium]|jgi:NAD+ diphosphatase|uniref:NAD(+) diphosphatase n=1 Tax=Haliea alexandrii TaxID=2448162 RepID=UPI000F0B4AC8|nr:NAD(+) diphosphatase [Haliea alexandrii]MCR9184605.1 NAD(+) diphosphatase [Halieaceae bacterium]
MSVEFHNRAPQSIEDALHLVFQGGQLVSDMHAEPLLPRAELQALGWMVVREQFLGYWHGRPCFAVEIDAAIEPDPMRFVRGNLYQWLGRVDDGLFALAGRATQLLAWERDHQYCGRCGAAMVVDIGERAMRCRPCATINYPRINPCVITLVTRGEELLLARNANFPGKMYSTLAGFIEAGESAEDTLHREVREEVGVEVTRLRYFGSQSWPFPSQLMLGYFADYAGGDIVCEPGEIADARWFHYSALPQVPPPSSIAGQLIRHYISELTRE